MTIDKTGYEVVAVFIAGPFKGFTLYKSEFGDRPFIIVFNKETHITVEGYIK